MIYKYRFPIEIEIELECEYSPPERATRDSPPVHEDFDIIQTLFVMPTSEELREIIKNEHDNIIEAGSRKWAEEVGERKIAKYYPDRNRY